MAQPLFGLVPTGLPVLTAPTETPSQTSFLYTIPPTKAFNHVVVFLLPGVALPPGTAAAIYLVTPPAPGQATPNSRFLGGIGEGKESAIFKISSSGGGSSSSNVVIGISIEDGASVGSRIAELSASKSADSTALVPAGGGAGQRSQPTTLVLAQRIIKNAFNFLASFSGTAGQVEVVPLKVFEEWWKKFETRVRSDPGFLERDD